MESLVKWVDKALSFMLISAMSGILLAVSWQVLSRYLLKDPSSFTEELARFLLIWIGLLGAAYAYRTHAHLGLNLVLNKLSLPKKRIAMMLVEVLVIVFASVTLAYGGHNLVYITLELEQISASLGVHMGYVYLVIPLSGALIIFYALYHLTLLAGRDWESKLWN